MTSYNYNTPTDNNQTTSASQPGEDSASHLCGCIRGISVVHCLQNGCYWHEEPENSQHQCSTTTPSCYVDISPDTDANLVVPSVDAVSDTIDITNNVTLSSAAIISSNLNSISRSTTPSPSLDTLIVKFNIGVTNDDHEVGVTASEETNVLAKSEVNTPAAGLISETLIVNADVINNGADIAPPPDVDVANNNGDTVALGSPDD